jgi:acetyltransferase-like isoleucine patch superfamily enzyme
MAVFKWFNLKLRNKFKVKGKHNILISPSAKLRNCRIRIAGEGNQLIIGDNVRLRGVHIELDGQDCQLRIEENCVIGAGCYLSSREKKTSLVLGQGCMLSRNVKIMTSDGHDISKHNQRINVAQSIHIGSRVWLTDNVTVLKGVTIGDGSVVGINSTLTKNVPNNAIAAGNPAKVVASDISWSEKLTY